MFVIVLIFFLLILLCSISLGLFVVAIDEMGVLERMFNPIIMYYNSNLNIFGVTVITIINYTIFFPAAILFWFYKLCTFGRK